MFKRLFKNKKEFIIYVIIAAISLTVCVFLLLKANEYFGVARKQFNYLYDDLSDLAYFNIKCGLRYCFCVILIIFLNIYHLVKLSEARLTLEDKAKRAEKKRRKIQRKINRLNNENKKIERKD